MSLDSVGLESGTRVQLAGMGSLGIGALQPSFDARLLSK
jgi:hypothetical protein